MECCDDPLKQCPNESYEEIEAPNSNKRRKTEDEDVGWTHEFEETVVRELKNFPCLWDRSLATFSKRSVCDPSRKHIVFMLKQNHPRASKEIREKLFTPASVGRKIRNLRLAYKRIKNRDGDKAKWRHFQQLSFLDSTASMYDYDNKANVKDFHFDNQIYQPPLLTIKCDSDTSTFHNDGDSKRFSVDSANFSEKATPHIRDCKCHSLFKFAQTVMDQLPIDQQKKFTVDVTKLLLKYQENNL